MKTSLLSTRSILFLILSFLLASACSNNMQRNGMMQKEEMAKASSTIYLVRHAEKESDGTKDPTLTSQGHMRAKQISTLLKDKNITQVFSTDYKRTRLTAVPTAIMMHLDVQIYNPRDVPGFVNQLENLVGENILVVGHSNSTPSLANAIMGDEIFTPYEESEYSNLISIIRTGNAKSVLFSNMDQ